ncbi:MAG: MarR family winged helix-turn-helix transcriptional regulator [Limnochordia bacterium]|jgi:DNA-binding MarR family transcriptional regulator
MEELLHLFLDSPMGLSLFSPELLQLDRQLSKTDALALLLLSRLGEASMSELAAGLGAPLSTMTGVVDRLVKGGLIIKERSPKDRRAFRLTPSSKGEETARILQAQIKEIFQTIQGALTPQELAQLIQLIQKIFTRLAKMQPKEKTSSSLEQIEIE